MKIRSPSLKAHILYVESYTQFLWFNEIKSQRLSLNGTPSQVNSLAVQEPIHSKLESVCSGKVHSCVRNEAQYLLSVICTQWTVPYHNIQEQSDQTKK